MIRRVVLTPIDRLHDLAARLGLSPKVFDPVVVALAGAVANWVATGGFDAGELRIAGAGLAYGLIGLAAPVLPGVDLEDVEAELGSTGRRRLAARRRRS